MALGQRRKHSKMSKFAAVSWYAPLGKWRATPNIDRVRYDLGVFETDVEANEAILKLRKAKADGENLTDWLSRWRASRTNSASSEFRCVRKVTETTWCLRVFDLQIGGFTSPEAASEASLEARRLIAAGDKKALKAWVKATRDSLRFENVVLNKGLYSAVVVTHGASKVHVLVDNDFVPTILNQRIWINRNGYAVTSVRGSNVFIHRMVMNLEAGDRRIVDHINRNPLDNRKSNLRYSNKALNGQNTGVISRGASKYRGVGKVKHSRWTATCAIHGVVRSAGRLFSSELDAAVAANRLRRRLMPHSNEGLLVKLNGTLVEVTIETYRRMHRAVLIAKERLGK